MLLANPDGHPGLHRTFVVRIRFLESSALHAAGTPVLRGSVEQVDGELTRYFTSIDEMTAIIRDGSGLYQPREEA